MEKPVLVIMAAGMGSRYGGLKQIDPVDPQGNIIMDYSIYDAVRAGFKKVIFVIKKENLRDFQEAIGDRISKYIETEYVFQELSDIPDGFEIPEGRVKPWGTGHAVLSCRNAVNGPFAVINADDYYGREAFRLAYEFLSKNGEESSPAHYMMVGYEMMKTLTENGSVSRGVCSIGENDMLEGVVERTRIIRKGNCGAYSEDDGNTWTELPPETIVSMNVWGFPASFMTELRAAFVPFLEKGLKENPLKCEMYLPFVVEELLTAGKADVKVMKTPDQWFGVTYKEDKPLVMEAFQKLKDAGIYPQGLWT